ncbi:RNA-binding protein [Candidatus Cerribacteria bacterium 'Amazon FNV 2010 28 9']|uniref:RNA-binding protein n=1 Tax=Candidatus Cerribacteria bacterium 'Amazon FNV 2010 28 9' TaxID=2081795 RepID=A0A317JQ70_9BACT|nr:MAG: RNA-binding protein [Candidatus Cerribacteria bacterium 'Amazon FNV 2010 28 9']
MDQQANPAKLFVGNLNYAVTKEQLIEEFSKFGTVTDAIVLSDRATGRSKGFGFVTMSTADEAQAAVQGLHDQEWEGRKLVVNVARPPAPRQSFGGGFGGGRSYGGGRGGNDRPYRRSDR